MDKELIPTNSAIKVVCAWCGKTIKEGVDNPVSHGICGPCYSDLFSVRSTGLKEFINRLPVPIFAVDSLGKAALSNSSAEELLGKNEENILGELGGDIFECIHSKKPGGCGNTIHCIGCTIRKSVEKTFATGEPLIDIPATLKVVHNATEKDVTSMVTTIRLEIEPGRPLVLLTIRDFRYKE